MRLAVIINNVAQMVQKLQFVFVGILFNQLCYN
jgi:hypothetical protein